MVFLPLLAMLATAPNPDNAVVVRPVANMYARPEADAPVVSQAIFSTNVAILDQNGAWLRVRTPDDYSGWIDASAALRSKPYAAGGRVAHVESLFANIYRETDITRHAPLLTLPFEAKLEVISGPEGEGARWVQVRLPDSSSAWVQSGDVELSLKPLPIPELIAWSKRFIGLPYLWGGTSTFGYDCSGFTQMLCRRRGFSIPRDAAPQAEWKRMKPVDKADLQPGDLLYFGDSPDKITHTGMYIGDGQFINATAYQHPAVQICNLNDEHWTKLLVAARRIKGK